MKKIFKFAGVTAFVSFVAFYRWLKEWATVVTMPSDTNVMVDGIKFVVRVIDGFLLAPPAWAGIIFLIVGLMVLIFLVFGSENLVKFARFFFKRDYRTAEFMKVSESDTVIAVTKAIIAEKILSETDWTPQSFPELPKSKTPQDALQTQGMLDYGYDLQMRVGFPEGRIENIIFQLTKAVSSEPGEIIMNRSRARIKKASDDAIINVDDWHNYERGHFFANENDRKIWHSYRGGITEANKIMEEFKRELERQLKEWESSPNADSARLVLEDIEIKRLP